jgi:hypothetical protein
MNDAITIIYLVLFVSIICVVIYLTVDFHQFKKKGKQEIQDSVNASLKTLQDMQLNTVNEVVTKTNSQAKSIYDELKGDVTNVDSTTKKTTTALRSELTNKLDTVSSALNTNLTNTRTALDKRTADLTTSVNNTVSGMTNRYDSMITRLDQRDQAIVTDFNTRLATSETNMTNRSRDGFDILSRRITTGDTSLSNLMNTRFSSVNTNMASLNTRLDGYFTSLTGLSNYTNANIRRLDDRDTQLFNTMTQSMGQLRTDLTTLTNTGINTLNTDLRTFINSNVNTRVSTSVTALSNTLTNYIDRKVVPDLTRAITELGAQDANSQLLDKLALDCLGQDVQKINAIVDPISRTIKYAAPTVALPSMTFESKATANKGFDVNGGMTVNGQTLLTGGKSDQNPKNWQTVFNWASDNKNYIRGDTEVTGHLVNTGDLTVNRNSTVNGTHTVKGNTTLANTNVNGKVTATEVSAGMLNVDNHIWSPKAYTNEMNINGGNGNWSIDGGGNINTKGKVTASEVSAGKLSTTGTLNVDTHTWSRRLFTNDIGVGGGPTVWNMTVDPAGNVNAKGNVTAGNLSTKGTLNVDTHTWSRRLFASDIGVGGGTSNIWNMTVDPAGNIVTKGRLDASGIASKAEVDGVTLSASGAVQSYGEIRAGYDPVAKAWKTKIDNAGNINARGILDVGTHTWSPKMYTNEMNVGAGNPNWSIDGAGNMIAKGNVRGNTMQVDSHIWSPKMFTSEMNAGPNADNTWKTTIDNAGNITTTEKIQGGKLNATKEMNTPRIIANDEICIKSTCIKEADLQRILMKTK